jgi:hypothetical protein
MIRTSLSLRLTRVSLASRLESFELSWGWAIHCPISCGVDISANNRVEIVWNRTFFFTTGIIDRSEY